MKPGDEKVEFRREGALADSAGVSSVEISGRYERGSAETRLGDEGGGNVVRREGYYVRARDLRWGRKLERGW